MLTVGDKLPSFRLRAAVSIEKGKEFAEIDDKSYEGKWLVLFAWPRAPDEGDIFRAKHPVPARRLLRRE